MRSSSVVLKSLTVFLGLGATCAACCLVPGAVFVFAVTFFGSLFASVGFGLFGWLGATVAIAAIAIVLTLTWRRVRPSSCALPALGTARPAAGIDPVVIPGRAHRA